MEKIIIARYADEFIRLSIEANQDGTEQVMKFMPRWWPNDMDKDDKPHVNNKLTQEQLDASLLAIRCMADDWQRLGTQLIGKTYGDISEEYAKDSNPGQPQEANTERTV
jgi:hypothetical protein